MRVENLSPAFTTEKIEESVEFYTTYLGATTVFDCGWYVNLQFGSETAAIQFMSPQNAGQAVGSGQGLVYNLCVADVDVEYERLMAAGCAATLPLDDHPWGDRGFAIEDPNGIQVYIYSNREPTAEFRQYYK